MGGTGFVRIKSECSSLSGDKIVFTLFIIVYGILSFNQSLFVNSDLGLNVLQPAHRIVEGQVPYRDFFAFYTPFSFYLLAGLFRILGENEQTIRIVLTMQGVAALVLLYKVARVVTRKKWLSFLPPLFLGGVGYPMSFSYFPHWLSGLWGMCVVLVLLPKDHFAWDELELPLYKALIAGLLSGMSFLTMQSRGVWLFLGVIIFILAFVPNKRIRCAVIASFGFLCPLLIGIMTAFHAGALGAFWEDAIVWPVIHYRRAAGYPYYYYYNLQMIAARTSELQSGISRSVEYVFSGFVQIFIGFQILAWLPAGILAVVRSMGRERYILGCVLTMGVTSFLSGIYRPDAVHMSQADLFGMTIWIGAMGFLRGFPYKAKLTTAAVIVVMSVGGLVKEFVMSPLEPLYSTERGPVRGDIDIADLQNFLKEFHPRSTEVCILNNSSHLYWLFSLENQSSWDVMLPGYNSAEQVAEATRELEEICPKWVIVDWIVDWISGSARFKYPGVFVWPKIDRELLLRNPLQDFLISHYALTSTQVTLQIYRRKKDKCGP